MASSTTLRFPDPLKAEAGAYADTLGVSLNALCAIALRDYLDARKVAAKTTPKAVAEPLKVSQPADEKVPLGAMLSAALPPVRRQSKKRRKR